MAVPTVEDNESWLNKAFGVPTVPAKNREHYPFSRDRAGKYRTKVGVLLLSVAFALYRMEAPCLRLSILLNCWLLFVTCEYLYKNYPWREPLNDWLWKFRLNVPYWSLLSTLCIVLLPLCWNTLGTGCRLPYPPLSACVGWLCLMLASPLVREYYWLRDQIKETDYDQFSAIRPRSLTWPRPIVALLVTLQLPSMLGFAAVTAAFWFVSLFLTGWVADCWTLGSGVVTLGLLAAICCFHVPIEINKAIKGWEAEEAEYALKIEETLNKIKGSIGEKMPTTATTRFDRLAIQVPLLQREVAILLKESRTLDEAVAQRLDKLTKSQEVMRFRKKCDAYGPYTGNCCIS